MFFIHEQALHLPVGGPDVMKGRAHLHHGPSPHSPDANDCAEIGRGIGIRDSKAPTTHLPVSDKAWSALLGLVRGAGR